MFELLNDAPEFDLESWELCRKLRESNRILIDAQRQLLLIKRKPIDDRLEELRLMDEELDAGEREAWRQRTGGFRPKVVAS